MNRKKMPFDLAHKKIWVAGETGLVGSALCRRLARENVHLISAPRAALDLTLQSDTEDWLAEQKPDVVILAAAKVGGIGANAASPAEFIRDNLAISQNVIHGAYRAGVKKLLFLGSSCIYPKFAAQPMAEDSLLTGALEDTNQWYAIAKIAGLKMCQAYRRQYGCDFISAMPTNLYGPGDRYDENISHVIPALLLKFHRAKMNREPSVTLWGTGSPLREFLYVDDLADALAHLLIHYSDEAPVNVGSGQEISIADLAVLVRDVTGYQGDIRFDPSKPDGTPRKLVDSSKINAMGWAAKTPLKTGIERTYDAFLSLTPRSCAA